MGKGRPGGNPEIRKYVFTTTREEPLVEKLTLRVSTSMKAQLSQIKDYPEFIRQAIQEKMERDGIKDSPPSSF